MPSPEATRSFELYRAKVITNENAPDECTIAPKYPPEGGMTTTWITAQEGAFCSVQSRR